MIMKRILFFFLYWKLLPAVRNSAMTEESRISAGNCRSNSWSWDCISATAGNSHEVVELMKDSDAPFVATLKERRVGSAIQPVHPLESKLFYTGRVETPTTVYRYEGSALNRQPVVRLKMIKGGFTSGQGCLILSSNGMNVLFTVMERARTKGGNKIVKIFKGEKPKDKAMEQILYYGIGPNDAANTSFDFHKPKHDYVRETAPPAARLSFLGARKSSQSLYSLEVDPGEDVGLLTMASMCIDSTRKRKQSSQPARSDEHRPAISPSAICQGGRANTWNAIGIIMCEAVQVLTMTKQTSQSYVTKLQEEISSAGEVRQWGALPLMVMDGIGYVSSSYEPWKKPLQLIRGMGSAERTQCLIRDSLDGKVLFTITSKKHVNCWKEDGAKVPTCDILWKIVQRPIRGERAPRETLVYAGVGKPSTAATNYLPTVTFFAGDEYLQTPSSWLANQTSQLTTRGVVEFEGYTGGMMPEYKIKVNPGEDGGLMALTASCMQDNIQRYNRQISKLLGRPTA